MRKRTARPAASRLGGWLVAAAAGLLLAVAAVVLLGRDDEPRGEPAQVEASLADRAADAEGRGDEAAAIELWSRHLERRPEDAAARFRLAVLLKRRSPGAALEQFRLIPPGFERSAEATRHVAEIALLTGRDDEAEAALRKLSAVDPSDFAVRLSLAELYYRTGRPKEALPHALASADLRPDRARTYLLIAELLDDLSRPGEMVAPLRKAIALEPDLYEARANLAYAEISAGNLDAAEREASWCLERNGSDPAVRRVLAAVARERGRHDEALAHAEAALASVPDDLPTQLLRADLLIFRREAEKAYGYLKPLYPAFKDRRAYLETLARAAAVSGRRDEAREYRAEVMRLIPEEGGGMLQGDERD